MQSTQDPATIQNLSRNFISINEFSKILGVQRTSFYKLMKEGKLPEPISLFTARKVWKRDVVEKFIQEL